MADAVTKNRTKVIELMNFAKTATPQDRAKAFTQALEILRQDNGALQDQFAQHVRDFQNDSSAQVRKLVIEFVEDYCKSVPARLVDNSIVLEFLLQDSTDEVAGRALTATNNLFRRALKLCCESREFQGMRALWDRMQAMVASAVRIMQAPRHALHARAVKFFETVIFASSERSGAAPHRIGATKADSGPNFFTLDDVPQSHWIRRGDCVMLRRAAHDALARVVEAYNVEPNEVDSKTVSFAVHTIANILAARPKLVTAVSLLSTVVALGVNPRASAAVRLAVKNSALSILKHCKEELPVVQVIAPFLHSIGATSAVQAVLKSTHEFYTPASKKTDGPAEAQAAKRPRAAAATQVLSEEQQETLSAISEIPVEQMVEMVMGNLRFMPKQPEKPETVTARPSLQQLIRKALELQSSAAAGPTSGDAGTAKGPAASAAVLPVAQRQLPDIEPAVAEQMSNTLVKRMLTPIVENGVRTQGYSQPWELLTTRQACVPSIILASRDSRAAGATSDLDKVKQVRTKALLDFIMDDFAKHVSLATTLLYQEYIVSQQTRSAWGAAVVRAEQSVYDVALGTLLDHLRTASGISDSVLESFFVNLPSLTTPAFHEIVALCIDSDKDRHRQGLKLLRSLAQQRPHNSSQCIDTLFRCALFEDASISKTATLIVVRALMTDSADPTFRARVVDFAKSIMQSLQAVQDDATDANLNGDGGVLEQKADSSDNTANEDTNMDGSTAEDSAVKETPVTKFLGADLTACPASESAAGILRRLVFCFSVATEEASLLGNFVQEFERWCNRVQTLILDPVQGISKLVHTLGTRLGADRVLPYFHGFSEGSVPLVIHALQTLADKNPITVAFIEAARQLWQSSAASDIRVRLPLLSALTREELMSELPNIISLPREMLQPALTRLWSVKKPPCSAAEFMVEVIRIEDEELRRSAIDMLQLFCDPTLKDVFSAKVHGAVLSALKQVFQFAPQQQPPQLLMRAVLGSLQAYPSLKELIVTDLMPTFVMKQIWTYDYLWTGFVMCAAETAPECFPTSVAWLPEDTLRKLMQHSQAGKLVGLLGAWAGAELQHRTVGVPVTTLHMILEFVSTFDFVPQEPGDVDMDGPHTPVEPTEPEDRSGGEDNDGAENAYAAQLSFLRSRTALDAASLGPDELHEQAPSISLEDWEQFCLISSEENADRKLQDAYAIIVSRLEQMAASQD